MISKSTILLSLLSILPHIHAQNNVACDGARSATVADVGPGETAQISLASTDGVISYSGCLSEVSHSIILIDVSDGSIVDNTCPPEDAGCDSRCIIDLGTGNGPFIFNITNTDDTETGDLTLTIDCEVTTTNAPTEAPTEATTTPSPTVFVPTLEPSTPPTISLLSSTMDMESDESLSFESDSGESDDDEDGSDLEDVEDDESDVPSLDGSVEVDDSAEARGGRTNNVFEAQSQTGDAGTDAMVWKYMWGIVAVFGVINVAICYCMMKNRKHIKSGEVSFQKVENSVDPTETEIAEVL